MVAKLSRQADAEGAARQPIIPKGWGRPAAAAPASAQPAPDAAASPLVSNIDEQRERIQATLRGQVTDQNSAEREMAEVMDTSPTPAERARAAFSPAIRAALEGQSVEIVQTAPSQEAATAPPATPDVPKPTQKRRAPAATTGDLLDQGFRLKVLELAISATPPGADPLKVANEMLGWVTAA